MPSESSDEMPPGMRRYIFGLYRSAPGRPELTAEEANRIQSEHVGLLTKLADTGEIIAAGPFEENLPERGCMILSTQSISHARSLLINDEAIKRGILKLDFYTWWGPVGLRHDPRPPVAGSSPSQ
jgi:uncharacterized protein